MSGIDYWSRNTGDWYRSLVSKTQHPPMVDSAGGVSTLLQPDVAHLSARAAYLRHGGRRSMRALWMDCASDLNVATIIDDYMLRSGAAVRRRHHQQLLHGLGRMHAELERRFQVRYR